MDQLSNGPGLTRWLRVCTEAPTLRPVRWRALRCARSARKGSATIAASTHVWPSVAVTALSACGARRPVSKVSAPPAVCTTSAIGPPASSVRKSPITILHRQLYEDTPETGRWRDYTCVGQPACVEVRRCQATPLFRQRRMLRRLAGY